VSKPQGWNLAVPSFPMPLLLSNDAGSGLELRPLARQSRMAFDRRSDLEDEVARGKSALE